MSEAPSSSRSARGRDVGAGFKPVLLAGDAPASRVKRPSPAPRASVYGGNVRRTKGATPPIPFPFGANLRGDRRRTKSLPFAQRTQGIPAGAERRLHPARPSPSPANRPSFRRKPESRGGRTLPRRRFCKTTVPHTRRRRRQFHRPTQLRSLNQTRCFRHTKFADYPSGPRFNSVGLNLEAPGGSFGSRLRENQIFGCSSFPDRTQASIGRRR